MREEGSPRWSWSGSLDAAVVGGIRAYGIDNLRQAADFLLGDRELDPVEVDAATVFGSDGHYEVDFSDV